MPNQSAHQRLREALTRHDFAVVIGTGVSLLLTDCLEPQLSWKGLIGDGFDYALRKGLINQTQRRSWEGQIASHDIDDLLSAAEFVSWKLGSPNGIAY